MREAPAILVVEDSFLVAESLCAILAEAGLAVVGPVASGAEALALLADTPVDGAILDINVRDGSVVPVAGLLAERGTPFVFVSGYGQPPALPEEIAGAPRLAKPVERDALLESITRDLGIECSPARVDQDASGTTRSAR